MLSAWSTFFSTAAESSATLAGLVMVAISVNIQRILAYKHLPTRASAAIGALVLVLILSLAALIPQPILAFTAEVVLAAVYSWVVHLITARRIIQGHREVGRPRRDTILSILMGQLQVLPLTVGAVLLALGSTSGLYWIAGTVSAALVVSVINAWVLLVEILR